MQNKARHGIFMAGVADAQPHTPISLAQMGMDGSQPIMPRMAAAHFSAQLAGGKIELVVKHHHIAQGQLVKGNRRMNRLARQVHEGFGLQQRHLFRPQTPITP